MRVDFVENRKQIVLSSDDTEYLDNAFPGNWESISEGFFTAAVMPEV